MQTQISTDVTAADTGLMPAWSEGTRSMPTPFFRSALFRPAGKAEPRQNVRDAVIEAADGVELLYSGEELRGDDEDVFLELLHMARGLAADPDMGVKLTFSGHDLLIKLEQGTGGKDYQWLRECINRLQSGNVKFSKVINGRRRKFQGQLIREFVVETAAGRGTGDNWAVYIGPHIRRMFIDALMVDQAQRKRIGPPFAKWLYGYLVFIPANSSHQMPESEIYRASASTAALMKTFRATLKLALTELQRVGAISSWSILKGVVYITKGASQAPKLSGVQSVKTSVDVVGHQMVLIEEDV